MRKIQAVRAAHHKGREISLAPPPQPKAHPTRSWWLGASRDHFTATAAKSLTPETLSAGTSMALTPWPGQREEGL